MRTLSRVSNYPYLYILYSTLRYELWKFKLEAVYTVRPCDEWRILPNKYFNSTVPFLLGQSLYGGVWPVISKKILFLYY